MVLISRTTAKSTGLKKFFTGRPCAHGHIAERFVANYQCVECNAIQGAAHLQTEQGKSRQNSEKYKGYRANFDVQYQLTDKKKNYVKDWKLKSQYGISTTDFNALVEQQGNKCKICSTPFSGAARSLTAPCVDHCHSTTKVRGILCGACNRMLGMAKDNISVLEAAIKYLQNSNQ
jgi:hypothetical protein